MRLNSIACHFLAGIKRNKASKQPSVDGRSFKPSGIGLVSSTTVVTRFVERWSQKVDPVEFTRDEGCDERTVCRILLADQHLCWKRGGPRKLGYYLEYWPKSLRSSADFLQLLVDEFGYREQSGRAESIESYLDRLQDLSDSFRNELAHTLRDDRPNEQRDVPHGETYANPQPRVTIPSDPAPISAQQASTRPYCEADFIESASGRTTPSLPRFSIDERIGEGAFGVVYRGRDLELERSVAIKVLRSRPAASDASVDSLFDEARKIAKLDCQGIVPVYQAGRAPDGRPFMIFKFVPGGDLRGLIRTGPIAPTQAAQLVCKCANALDSAHRAGIVHRDIKPANILVDDTGNPWITDFGLAAFEKDIVSGGGEITGTPAYMSPEQTLGQYDQIDGRTDIWSLGVILYELLTGRLPFQGETYEEVFAKVQTHPPIPIRMSRPEIAERLEEICLRCLEKKVDARFKSARALALILDQLLASNSETDRAESSNDEQASLVFHIAESPFSYVPKAGSSKFTIGRQRRKSSDCDQGCDFVIRCAKSDIQSLQISRTHLEVLREDGEYSVLDRSKLGTLLNGRKLEPGQRTPIKGGDQLMIANVLTLQVLSVADATLGTPIQRGMIHGHDDADGEYIVEASLGDLTTMEPARG